MKGKDLKRGAVFGTKRVREVVARRSGWVLFTYDYLAASERGEVFWYIQAIPPVGRVHVNKVLPAPSEQAPEGR